MPSLSEQWEKFSKEQNEKLSIDKKVSSTKQFLVRHNDAFAAGKKIATTVSEFYINKKSPYILVKGAFDLLSSVGAESGYYSYEYFRRSNGWFELFDRRTNSLSKLLASVLQELPYTSLSFKYDQANCKIYQLPIGEFAYVKSKGWTTTHIFYYKGGDEAKQKEIIDWLVAEKIKHLNSVVLTLKDTKSETDLTNEPINPQPSKRAEKYVAHYKKAFALGINRSVLFYGPPGSGKTSLSHTIVTDLGLKTLIYKDDTYEGMDLFMFVVEKFGIEAIIFDDFDQCPNTKKLLGTLDLMHRKMKLMIGLVNTMHDFHPAVIRPRRFDEREKVDSIEEDIVRATLGSLNEAFFERVKHWPIAYIDELSCRAKLHEGESLEPHFDELNDRVEKQLKALKRRKKRKTKKKPVQL